MLEQIPLLGFLVYPEDYHLTSTCVKHVAYPQHQLRSQT